MRKNQTINTLKLSLLIIYSFLSFEGSANNENTIISPISGSIVVCEGSSELYTAPLVSGNSYYWSVTGGTGTSSPNPGSGTHNFAVTWGSHTSSPGSITLVVYDGTTLVDSTTQTVTISDLPEPEIFSDFNSECGVDSTDKPNGADQRKDNCHTVCEGMLVNYSTAHNSGNSYQWNVLGPHQSITGETTATASIVWDIPGQAYIEVIETTPEGCEWRDTLCIKIIEKPLSSFEVAQGQNTIYSSPGSVASGAATISTCLNSEICFTETAVGEVNWFWDFGDGFTSTQQNPCHIFSTPGIHEVTLVVENECSCRDTSVVMVEVDQTEGLDIVCKNVLCEESMFTYESVFPTTPCTGAEYTWTVSGNGTITGSTGTVNASTSQSVTGSNITSIDVAWGSGPTGSISLQVTGCSGVCDDIVTVEIPIIPQTIPIEGDTILCVGEDAYFNVPCFPGTKYSWIIDGVPQSDVDNDIWTTFYLTGTHTVELSYINDFLGCQGRGQIFNVQVLPTTLLSGPTAICEGEVGTFNAFAGTNYIWEIQDNSGSVVHSTATTNTFNTPATLPAGSYTLTATDNGSPVAYCNVPSKTFEVISTPSVPDTPAGDTVVCNGEVIVYNSVPSSSDHYLMWEILNGGVTDSITGNSVTVNWSPDPKSITLTQFSSKGGCPSAPLVVPIYDQPAPSGLAIVGSDTVCGNTPLSSVELFTANQALEGYYWTLSPDTAGSIINSSGADTIEVVWNNYEGTASLALSPIVCYDTLAPVTYNVEVIPFYDLILTGPDTVCQGAPSTWNALFALGGGSSFAWEILNPLSGSTISSGTSNSATFDFADTSGSFVLSYTAYGPNCAVQSVVTKNILVHPEPVANLSFSGGNHCISQGSGVDFFLSVSGAAPYQYEWYLGSSNIASNVTSYFAPPVSASAGAYYVNITDANNCTNSSNIVNLYDNCDTLGCLPPTGDVSFNYTVNADCKTVQFTPSFTGNTPSGYFWEFADLGTSSSASPSFTFPASGNYTVELNGIYGGDTCSSIFQMDVVVPVISNYELNISCVGNNYQIDLVNTSDVVNGPLSMWNHNWSLNELVGGGVAASSSAQNFNNVSGLTGGASYVLILNESLTYSYSGQTINGNCTLTDTIDVPQPVDASFVLPMTVCEDQSLPFVESSVGDISVWTWDFGDGSSIYSQNTQKTYVNPGTYNVELLVVDEYGCKDSVNQTLTIQPNNLSGDFSIAPVQPMCPSSVATINFNNTTTPASSPYMTVWNSGATGSSVTSSQTSTHFVTLTDNYGCEKFFGPAVVEVSNIPVPVIEGEANLCIYEDLYLTANYGGQYSYSWEMNNGSGWTPIGLDLPSLYYFGSASGTIDFRVTVDNGTCSETSAPFNLTVHSNPVAPNIISGSTPACPDTTIELSVANATMFEYISWSNGTTGAVTWVNNHGTYQAEGVDSNGCKSTGNFTVQPLPDFCGFMCGCYQDCIEQGQTYSFPAGVNGSFPLWEWEELVGGSWTVVSSGSGVVPDYTTATPGLHPIRLYVENNAGCGAYSCETDLTLTQCPDKGCEVDYTVREMRCEVLDNGEVAYNMSMVLNFAHFGEECENYEVVVTAPFGTMTGSPVLATAGSNALLLQWNTGMSYYPGGVVCFDVQIKNLCDSSICTKKVCVETTKCGEVVTPTPCEGGIVVQDVGCKSSHTSNANYYFEMNVDVVPFGEQCDEYTISIATPSGSVTFLSSTTLYSGSNTITGMWDTGLTSFASQEVCFTVTITNGCHQFSSCETEVCFEVPDCRGTINGVKSMNPEDLEKFSLFPNPTKDKVNIQFPVKGRYEVAIINMRGERLKQYTLGAEAFTSYSFDIHELPEGVYLIQCSGESYSQTKTVIISE